MNQKIACYKCSSKIELPVNLEPLAQIECPNCQAEITVPYIVGDLILEKRLSEGENSSSYKGYRQNSSKDLLIRVLNQTVSDESKKEDFCKALKGLNGNLGNELSVVETDKETLIVRPYYPQALANYLAQKRPSVDSAYKMICSLVEQVKKAAAGNHFLADLSVKNLYVNNDGDLILTDFGVDSSLKELQEKVNADTDSGMAALVATVYEICCGKPYVAGIAKATLSFRDDTPQDLHDLVNELLQQDTSLKSLSDIQKYLQNVDLKQVLSKPVEKTVNQKKTAKKKSSSGSLIKSKKTKKPQLKSKNILKKNRRKSAVGIPLVLTVIILLLGVFWVIKDGTIFNVKEEPVVVKKAPKVEKKKPKPVKQEPIKVVEIKEIKPLPKFEEKVDMKGEISLHTFSEIMESKCISCHGQEGQEVEGKFNLVKLMASNGIHNRHWQAVYEQVASGDMPPEDEEPLSDDEKLVVLDELRRMTSQTEASRKTRALTPDEIKNTLVDIFRIDQDTYNPFTPLYANYAQDDFYTTQKSVITPYYLDDLYETLHDALESYVGLKPQTEPLNLQATFPKRVPMQWKVGDQAELRWNASGYYFVPTQFKNLEPVVSKKKVRNRDLVGPKSNIDAELAKLTLPPGTYKLSFDAQAVNLGRSVNEKKFGPEVARIFDKLAEKQEYSLPMSFFIVPPGQADPHARIKDVTTININSSEMSRYTVEFTLNRRNGIGYRFPVGLMPGAGQIANLIANHQVKGRPVELKDREKAMNDYVYNDKYDFAKILLKNVTIEGPYDVYVSPYSLADSERFNNINIRKKFRALHNENLIKMNMSYDYIFDKFRQRQIEREESYRNSLVAFFLSTEFLTLDYDLTDPRKHGRMLSYVFHKSTPASELKDELEKAVKTKSTDGFADWLISHPHFSRYIDSFTKQWLHLSNVNEAMPDKRKFGRFYREDLMSSYTEEVKQFILYLILENRPVNELVSANYSVIDNKLISFYDNGRNHVDDGFKKYEFRDKGRGGILATGAFLTATGNGVEQLPIKRAEWILKNLLDSQLPPPPADIPLDDFQQDLSAPLHKRLEAHSSDPKCYSCHKKIDPLAIMMNQFNTIGDFDHNSARQSVKLNDEILRNFADFKKYLGSQEEAIARSFVKSILRYSLGRELYVQDMSLLNKIIDDNRADGFLARDLMKSVVKYYFF